jgi:hypothetical protein
MVLGVLQALDHMKTAKLPRCYYDFMDQLKTNPAGEAVCITYLIHAEASNIGLVPAAVVAA